MRQIIGMHMLIAQMKDGIIICFYLVDQAFTAKKMNLPFKSYYIGCVNLSKNPFLGCVKDKKMQLVQCTIAKQLLRYSTLDELHFFIFHTSQEGIFRQVYASDIVRFKGEIHFFGRESLIDQIKANDYTVFHLSDQHVHANDLAHIRNR